MSSLSLTVTAWSERGPVRTKNDDHYLCGPFVEQDSLFHLAFPLSSALVNQYGFVCAVADGMGGYAGGALASVTVLETLSGFFYAQKRTEFGVEQVQAAIEEGLDHARTALNGRLRREPQFSEAGTTLAGLAVLADGYAIPFHAGDSRILRWSAGFVRALTTDHTPLASEIALGRLSERDAANSPLASQLTRSFGLDETSPVEWGEAVQLAAGDLFLIGTDGWHGLGHGITKSELSQILAEFEGDDRDLIRVLLAKALESDGSDNATLILMRVTDAVSS